MKIALFGSTGLVGRDLVKKKPDQVNLFSASREVDLVQRNLLQTYLSDIRPDWVVNVAAYNNVDGAERERDLARAVNVQGPDHLAQICRELDIPLIHFSTDYVFPEATDRPFLESDPPQPRNEYGRSKLDGENAVGLWSRHYILRTSALYGFARRTHAQAVMEAVKSGRPARVAEDLFCSPTYTGDLAEWVYRLIVKKPAYGVYHLCHKGWCTRYEFAEKICEELGAAKPYPLEKISLADLKLPAPRVRRPLLGLDKWERAVGPLSTWQDGLKRFLAEVGRS